MATILGEGFKEKTDGLYYGNNKISTFCPRIVHLFEIDSGQKIERRYEIECLENGLNVGVVKVKSLFVPSWHDMNPKIADASMSLKNRKLVQEYLEQQVKDLPIEKIRRFQQYGFCKIEEDLHYYSPGWLIAKDSSIPIITKQKSDSIIYADEMGTNFLDVQKCTKCLSLIQRISGGKSWVLFIISLLGALKYYFRQAGFPVTFMTNVFGNFGVGKTRTVQCVCNISYIT